MVQKFSQLEKDEPSSNAARYQHGDTPTPYRAFQYGLEIFVTLRCVQACLTNGSAYRCSSSLVFLHPGVKRVKTVTQIGKEVFALAKSLGQRKAHVVAVHGVGHDELRRDITVGFFDLHPKRQVVTVIVAVVFKATMVCDQSMGIGTVAAGIPTGAMDRVAVRGLGYARKDLDAFCMCARSVASSIVW